jgi:hypothetical protein
MPDGVVRWFDAKSGKGRIGHVEREYVVLEADIEPEARVSQARVQFDAGREAAARGQRVPVRGTPVVRGARQVRRSGRGA